jgi:hypothetical protein
MSVTILDGGCVLYQLPVRSKPTPKLARKKWRPMTVRERWLAIVCTQYTSGDFVEAMWARAHTGQWITDRQGRAIWAVGRHHGISVPTSSECEARLAVAFAIAEANQRREDSAGQMLKHERASEPVASQR